MPFVDEVIRLEVIALATVLGIVASIITIFRGIHAAGAWFSGNRAEARRIVFSTVLISVALMLPALLSGIGLFWIDNFIACSTTLYEEGSCPEAYTASYVLRIVYYFAIVSFIPSTLTLAAFHPVHRWLDTVNRPIVRPDPLAQAREMDRFSRFMERFEELVAYYSLRLLVSVLLIAFFSSLLMAIQAYAFIRVNPEGALPIEYTSGNFAIDLAAFAGGCLATPLALALVLVSPISYRLILTARTRWRAA